jgi:hypothetical protein
VSGLGAILGGCDPWADDDDDEVEAVIAFGAWGLLCTTRQAGLASFGRNVSGGGDGEGIV